MTQSLITSTFPVTVDYDRTLSEMIAASNYDYVNSDITADCFPVTGEGKQDLEIVLMHFNRNISSEKVLEELDALGLRPATLPELLAFGEIHPDVQRQFPIICLGSTWRIPDSGRSVPFLGYWDGKRGLFLDWFEDRWSGDCRFAAVKK